MKNSFCPKRVVWIFSMVLTLFLVPFPVHSNDLLKETFVRGVPCGNLLAKLTLLESCQELEEFFAKWEPRAEQGDPLAMTLIGLKYYQHEPTREKAPDYFIRAARQDFGPAQLELGMLYEKGMWVPQDDLQAFLWYSLAAAKGEEKAVDCLESLKGRMDAQSQASANELLRKWRPTPHGAQPSP
ncbi:MAG: sel1 repeat family protein [Desulfuromonadaceae bacterium]|nr:sel1 repeat family protein [Desulfuromonadaceae bacterium]